MFITRLVAMKIPSGFIDSGTYCLLTYSIFPITMSCFTKWLENILFRVFDMSEVNIDIYELSITTFVVKWPSLFLSFCSF